MLEIGSVYKWAVPGKSFANTKNDVHFMDMGTTVTILDYKIQKRCYIFKILFNEKIEELYTTSANILTGFIKIC